jgi:hypothetical protein
VANERILPDIQRDCEVRMNSDPFFQSIAVINYRKGDVSQDVAAALAGMTPKNGRAGACVVILQPVAVAANRNVRFPPFKATYSFLIMENPLFNDDANAGTGIRGEQIGRRLLDLFCNFHPVGVTTPFIPEEPFMRPTKVPVPIGIDDVLLPNCWECSFSATEARGRQLHQPNIPTIIIGANITITCSTGAVDIYYTADGSPPGPPAVSPGSALYTGPFTLPYSAVIRAVAMRQQVGYNWTPSDIAWAEWDVELAEGQGIPISAQSEGGENIGV